MRIATWCLVPAHCVKDLEHVSVFDGPPWDRLSDRRPLVVDKAPVPGGIGR